jgi:hypothetical protein
MEDKIVRPRLYPRSSQGIQPNLVFFEMQGSCVPLDQILATGCRSGDEKRGSAELLDIVSSQRDQMDELSSKVEEGEKNCVIMEARIEQFSQIMLTQS